MRSRNTSWLSGTLIVLCSLLAPQEGAAQAAREGTSKTSS